MTPPEVAALLQSTMAALRAELGALSDDVLRWHPAPGEWCAKEVVGHLIEAERRGFAGRIRTILGFDGSTLEAWDQDAVARARGDCARDMPTLLAEFATMRHGSVDLVAGLGDPDLERAGIHPEVGLLRVHDLLHEWLHHDRNHLRQLLANVQAYVWPDMGNAQRFSAP